MKLYFQEKHPMDYNGFVVSAFEANDIRRYKEYGEEEREIYKAYREKMKLFEKHTTTTNMDL